MRYREFLLEYNRDITKKNFGEKLLAALQKERPRDDNWNLLGDPVQKQQLIDAYIKQLEDADPTPHKEYVQWMARKFTDPKNLVQFEDYLGQLPMYLKKFHKLKQRRMLDNPRNDINKYDNVPDFMNVMDEYPDPETAQAASNKGSATTYYEDKDLRIIEPRDQQAACYYGQGTRWCTAATVGKNYFTNYYSRGPLYILIPKHPKYNGEKYQFHFSTNSFMDEKDQRISAKIQNELLERYPKLGEIFLQQIRQYHNGYWMKGGTSEQDKQRIIKSLKNNIVDMPDGSHVLYLNDDVEVEHLDITKELKAKILFTNGLKGADDADSTDPDLSRGGVGLPLLVFAIFNKDYTDGVFVYVDVTGDIDYTSPKTDRLNQDMPEDIKPVYNELLKIVKDPKLDIVQSFDRIQEKFVPISSRMDMRDINEYLNNLDEGYTKNGQYSIREITNEASPDTLEGSFTDDLVISKQWLANKLKQGLGNKCARTIYILGSWYGNLALFLQKADIIFDHIVLIDKDTNVLKTSEKILRPLFKPGQLIFIDTDAKDVIYDKPGIVINTSINDMDIEWFDNVPKNMHVIIQGRDAVDNGLRIADMEQFDDMFPLSQVNYLGKMELSDPETEYTRYMKIGRK